MQNHQLFSRLLVAASMSLASVAAVSVHAADDATSASAPAAAVDDATITTRVKSALLEDKQVQSLKITVTTENGVVKMSGVVPSADVGNRALQLAARVPGVKDIKNELKLKDS